MASILNTVLPSKAIEIRDETDAGENTATRVGELFKGIIDYIGSQEPDWLRDTVGTGQGQITGLGELVGSLNDLNNPGNLNQILAWKNSGSTNPNGWGYITTPTGGTGTGNGDVTWDALTGPSSGYKIHSSYLTDALSDYLTNAKLTNTGANASKYTWWGRYLTPSTSGGVTNYKVEGPLSGGITYIQFSNGVKIEAIAGTETTSPALRVVDANTTAGTADFYAMGGVSALGRSSSSSGGGGDTPVIPTDLGAILNHVKNNTASVNPVPNIIPEGATIRWDGNDWVVDKTTWGDLGAAPSLTNIGDTGYLKCKKVSGGYNYSWVPIDNVNINKLSSIGDVKSYNPNSDGILYYVNNASSSEKWQYRKFVINSNDTTTNGYDLTSIILNDTKYTIPTYSLPLAASGTRGGIQIGFSESNSGSSSDRNYAVKLSSEKAYVNVPWTDTDTTYTGSSSIDVSNSGNHPISVRLTSSNSGLSTEGGLHINSTRTLWGNQDTLLNDIGKSGDNKSLSYVQDISMYGTIVMNTKNSQIQMADPAGITRNIINLTDKNQADVYYGNTVKAFLDIGYGSARVTTGDNKSVLRLWGNDIIFKANGSDGNKNIMILTKEGSTYLPLATTGPKEGNTYTGAGPAAGLRIGDAVLYWDEKNQALALAKYNTSQPSNPTAANFYATGGVSALGFSNGTSSIDAMTFGNLTVNNKLAFNSSLAYVVTGQNTQLLRILGDADADYVEMFYDYDNSKISSTQYYFTDYCNVGIKGELGNGEYKWSIDPDGCAQFSRIYLSNNAYIYFASNDVKLQIGSSTYTLTKQ